MRRTADASGLNRAAEATFRAARFESDWKAPGKMSILYLATSPDPQLPDTDAVFRQIATLQAAFAGERICLAPATSPRTRYPRLLFGLQRLGELRRAEARTRVTHIFHPTLYCFPVLRWLRNPIVFTVTAGLARSLAPRGLAFLRNICRVVVCSDADAQILRNWGMARVEVIRPGLDLSRFRQAGSAGKADTPHRHGDRDFHLLMASAPWAERQFSEKGIDATLEAAALAPHLAITILLRGSFEPELRRRIARLGIERRTRIVNEKVDVREYLRAADAVVLAATRPDIVVPYPHSLLEALAAGKPVITSREIAMADLVASLGAGVVVDEVNPQTILAAANAIADNRQRYLQGVGKFDSAMFSVPAMIEAYGKIYNAARQTR